MTAAIAVRGLSHRYRGAQGSLTVLDNLSFDIPAGGYAALTGPSGAGKTTLLSVLGGLEAVQDGEVRVGDCDLAHLGGDELAAYRRDTVGFVFQHFGLLETLTAAENVELARALSGVSLRRRRSEAHDLLGAVGLRDRQTHLPHQLSGGERQRVAIARALANHPTLLLADEPTGNLDDRSAQMVMGLLETLPAERDVTLVIVTHNAGIAGRASIRLAMEDGRLDTPDPEGLDQRRLEREGLDQRGLEAGGFEAGGSEAGGSEAGGSEAGDFDQRGSEEASHRLMTGAEAPPLRP